MDTQASLSGKIASGLADAAKKLGSLHSIYRPVNVTLPAISSATWVADVLASFPRNYGYKLPIDATKPQRVAVMDTQLVKPGDYVSDGRQTYFIANTLPMMPTLAIVCNNVVSLFNQAALVDTDSGVVVVGDVGNFGKVLSGAGVNQKPLLAQWPASVLYAGRGAKTAGQLPTDDTAAQWSILLPATPFTMTPGDIISDFARRHYSVVAYEQNETGTHIIATQAEF